MRTVLIIILLFAIALPAFPQLTEQAVRQIIREELEPVKLDVAEMKGKMVTKDELEPIKSDVAEMKGKMEAMKGKMDALRGEMATKDEVQSLYRWIIAMWITIILAIFAIPYLYGRSDRERVKDLAEELRNRARNLKG